MRISVQTADFDLGAELAALRAGRVDAGALVSFTGIVRDERGDLTSMTLEHYPAMTEAALQKIAQDAAERWGLLDAAIIHRYGTLYPGDQIMMVAAIAGHRAASFEAADFMMDFLKSRAPFWKKETRGGKSAWVEAKTADDTARERWDKR